MGCAELVTPPPRLLPPLQEEAAPPGEPGEAEATRDLREAAEAREAALISTREEVIKLKSQVMVRI